VPADGTGPEASEFDPGAPEGDPSAVSVEPCILHVDMDSFYAAVEQLDDPTLAGKPVVVGGSGPRGVVASCSYEARASGIRSAMPSVRARRLCPDAVFVSPRFDRYREVSGRLREIMLSRTPLVEPLGLDEAYLDVRGARRLLGSPERIADGLREQVHDELSLWCSIGVGRTKQVAKLASRAAKPTASRGGVRPGPGVVVVLPAEERDFLWPMPIEALWGVGPATAKRLRELGIATVEDLAKVPEEVVLRRLGAAHGRQLAQLARGVDPRPVVPEQQSKSIGHEETFASDLVGIDALRPHVRRMAESVGVHLRSADLRARTVTLKVRFDDFSTVTRSRTLPTAVDAGRTIGDVSEQLLSETPVRGGVRLLGVSASNLTEERLAEQLSLLSGRDPEPSEAPTGGRNRDETGLDGGADPGRRGRQDPHAEAAQWRQVEHVLDAVSARFGPRRIERGPSGHRPK
jgi:DNA polymerase IV